MPIQQKGQLKPYPTPFIRQCLRFVGSFLVLITLLFPFRLSAQEHLSIIATDTSLASIFDQIRNQSEIDFIYNDELLAKCDKVSINVKDVSIEDVLEMCLDKSILAYQKINHTIIIIPASEVPTPSENKVIYGKLKGSVIDHDARIPLSGATVLVISNDGMRASATDVNGNFKFNKIPVGRHSVRVSYIGYGESIVSELFVGSSRETFVNVSLSEKIDSLGEVSIGVAKGNPINDMAIVSSKSFSVEETKRYAASMNDPARMVQVFAGVTGHDDSSNEIVVRGNSPNWMQWRLEGVEIPSPNHFSEEGYTSGAISILSSDLLAQSDFYMGAFPAEFGNALSGVFDLRLRNGNNEDYEFSAQAGILGFDFSAEGPFSKNYNGSFLVNYRYSSLAILNNVNIQISENAVPKYQDLSFKINLPTKKAGNFSIWAISGKSEVLEEYLTANATKEGSGYRDFTRSGMYATGITHTIFPDTKSYFRTVLSHSYNYSGELYEITNDLGELALDLEDKLRNNALRFSSLYNRKINQQLTIRTGITWNNTGYDYLSILYGINGNMRTFLNGTGRTNLMQSYLQAKYRLNDQITSTIGIHYAWFSLSNDHSIEPRLGLKWDLGNNQYLTFGFGHHSKNEDLPVYLVENKDEHGNSFNPNINLKMTRSKQYVLGYEKLFKNDIQMKTEAYFQHINNLPVPTNPEKYWPPFFGNIYFDTLSNIGRAQNYGIELTLQKFYTKGYYWLITGSLFDAKYQPANKQWYNSRYNSNYASNLVGGKEFHIGEKQLLDLNAKVVWYGGKRILPIDLDASNELGEAVFVMEDIFAYKGLDYFRIDVGANWHFFKAKSEHILSINIQNLSNRSNILSDVYDPIQQTITHYYLAGLIPVLHYRIEF